MEETSKARAALREIEALGAAKRADADRLDREAAICMAGGQVRAAREMKIAADLSRHAREGIEAAALILRRALGDTTAPGPKRKKR